jgi:hypothetical protein
MLYASAALLHIIEAMITKILQLTKRTTKHTGALIHKHTHTQVSVSPRDACTAITQQTLPPAVEHKQMLQAHAGAQLKPTKTQKLNTGREGQEAGGASLQK